MILDLDLVVIRICFMLVFTVLLHNVKQLFLHWCQTSSFVMNNSIFWFVSIKLKKRYSLDYYKKIEIITWLFNELIYL